MLGCSERRQTSAERGHCADSDSAGEIQGCARAESCCVSCRSTCSGEKHLATSVRHALDGVAEVGSRRDCDPQHTTRNERPSPAAGERDTGHSHPPIDAGLSPTEPVCLRSRSPSRARGRDLPIATGSKCLGTRPARRDKRETDREQKRERSFAMTAAELEACCKGPRHAAAKELDSRAGSSAFHMALMRASHEHAWASRAQQSASHERSTKFRQKKVTESDPSALLPAVALVAGRVVRRVMTAAIRGATHAQLNRASTGPGDTRHRYNDAKNAITQALDSRQPATAVAQITLAALLSMSDSLKWEHYKQQPGSDQCGLYAVRHALPGIEARIWNDRVNPFRWGRLLQGDDLFRRGTTIREMAQFLGIITHNRATELGVTTRGIFPLPKSMKDMLSRLRAPDGQTPSAVIFLYAPYGWNRMGHWASLARCRSGTWILRDSTKLRDVRLSTLTTIDSVMPDVTAAFGLDRSLKSCRAVSAVLTEYLPTNSELIEQPGTQPRQNIVDELRNYAALVCSPEHLLWRPHRWWLRRSCGRAELAAARSRSGVDWLGSHRIFGTIKIMLGADNTHHPTLAAVATFVRALCRCGRPAQLGAGPHSLLSK